MSEADLPSGHKSVAEPGVADLADAAPGENTVEMQILTDAMPQIVWSTLPDGYHDYYNARWYEFTGVPVGSTDGEAWSGMFHADDQERAWALWRHSLATGDPYEVEYRLRHASGEYRWVLGRAMPVRDREGRITRWIGTCTDIDHAKRVAEQNEILTRELSHRIKNIFAVIGGLVGLSARRYPHVTDYAQELRGRIDALGRAHEFVRPHSEHSAPLVGPSTLHRMLHDLLGPYPALADGRLLITGDDVAIDDRGATPIALVFHELATNAAKYGALSVAEGHVTIASEQVGDRVTIVWREDGGPTLQGDPTHKGFGTRLTELSIEQQLGGEIVRQWLPSGLEVRMALQSGRLRRD